MAIIFDTTVGGTSSTSYVTVAEFNEYVEKLVNTDNIPKSSQTTLIKKLLIAATEAVDVEVSNSGGSVTDSTQRLEYPRTGITNRRGNAIADDVLPQELKDAVSEMAIWLYQNDANHASHDNWDDEVSSASIGSSISLSYDTNGKPSTLIPERVKFLLSYIGTAYKAKTNRVRRS